MFYAIKRGDLSIIKYLVEEIKVNVNHREYQDRTLFYLAAFEGELNIVNYLYTMGADPELGSKLDRTPLSKACYLGHDKVVAFLISINVNLTKQDNKGRTALHNAVWGSAGGR
jgi:exosome complex exonuclease RRP6